ncbi:MAG: hypothetical protein JXA99_17265 [Candidatus Lokiarchaeota archaeon]|nr:hypothetical protein [Candidatus Lokiarchaeota archaeon]
MGNGLREFHYPFIFIVLIIAYQISAYFFYRYFKVKKEQVEINKILLAFGLLYGFGFTGIIIRTINSFYIDNLQLSSIFMNLSHILVFIGILSFLLIISQKTFNQFINIKVTRIISIITIILSILILIFMNINIFILGILILVALFIGGIYLLFFHISLIQKSKGNIRNRFVYLLIGELIIVIVIVFGAEKMPSLFSSEQQNIVKVISNPLIIFGQLIVFYSIYDFPIFLEFNWQKCILKLYIIDVNKLKILYQYKFDNKNNDQIKLEDSTDSFNIIFSGGIIGIKKLLSSLTKSKESTIEKIRQGEYFILLTQGEADLSFLTYCLLIKKEMISIQYFLNLIKKEFIKSYGNILYDLDSCKDKENQIFLDFNKTIENILKTN